MRPTLPVLFGCVLLAVPVFAQRGGHSGGGGGMRGASGGFHGSVSSGGFRSGGAVRRGGFGGTRAGFGGRYSGFRGLRGYYYPGFYGGFYDPYLWGSGYGWDSGYGYQDSGYGYPDSGYGYQDSGAYPPYAPANPSVVVVSNEAPPPPSMIVQQAPPASSAWSAGPQSQQAQKYEDQLFLVALHDGTIRAVVAYWVDGTTVHYVTMDHEQKQTPLTSIDRSLSERLNRERNVTFRLPG